VFGRKKGKHNVGKIEIIIREWNVYAHQLLALHFSSGGGIFSGLFGTCFGLGNMVFAGSNHVYYK
jgi:hypothetical protein